MFEGSVATIPSLWASMNSWLTPAVLFVLLNVMIGTIAFTSTLANQNKHHHHHHQQHHDQNQQQQQQQHQQQQNQNLSISRSPSLLQRLRSINFYSYRSQQPPILATDGNFTSTTTTAATQFKISPDSNTLYDFELAHQQEVLENPSHYSFDQPQVESQPEDAHSEYEVFHQNAEANREESNTHYFFEQTHEVESQENGAGYGFEGENEVKFNEEDHNNGENDDGLQSLDEVYSKLTGLHVSRTKSDTAPASGEIPSRLPARIRKSASMKSPFGHFEMDDDHEEVVAAVEARRPATVRERGVARAPDAADEEVDAKADDFINKFKQQLKLQRLDSIIRYKDMITKGSGGK